MTDEYYAIANPLSTASAAGAMITTVRLSGEFDLGAREDLRTAVDSVVADGIATSIVFDLTDAVLIDAAAVGVLFSGYLAARHRGRDYRVANAASLVQRVLDVLDPTNLLQPDRPSHTLPYFWN